LRGEQANGYEVDVVPASDALSIQYLYPADGVTVVSLTGDCDLATAALVSRALSFAMEENPATLVLDLSETTFLDSTGLRVIHDANTRRKRKGLDGLVLVTNEMTQRLFEITVLASTVAEAPDLESALRWRVGRWIERGTS